MERTSNSEKKCKGSCSLQPRRMSPSSIKWCIIVMNPHPWLFVSKYWQVIAVEQILKDLMINRKKMNLEWHCPASRTCTSSPLVWDVSHGYYHMLHFFFTQINYERGFEFKKKNCLN